MTLYYEASRFLLPPCPHTASQTSQVQNVQSTTEENESGTGLSLASRVFSQQKSLKSKAALVFKVVVETRKWDGVLAGVVERSGVLEERLLTPSLALLLTHDLLLSRSGIAAPRSHPLVQAITRHKARLSSEFTRARIKAGFSSVAAWRDALACERASADGSALRPRWARVNALRGSVGELMEGELARYRRVGSLREAVQGDGLGYVVDEHVPDLLAFAAGAELVNTNAYRDGRLILQDKASCMPACLLDPGGRLGDVIDACAAPGNKTSHLAALMQGQHDKQLYAIERDRARSHTLTKMLTVAGARDTTTVLGSTDFLQLDPHDARFADVTGILLDPSCSGSGMLGRDEDVVVILPRTPKEMKDGDKTSKSSRANLHRTISEADSAVDPQLLTRLTALSQLQSRLVVHAFSFPHATRVVYSTCSVHPHEDELVVLRVLSSEVARRRGWRVLRREEQVDGMRRWPHRGASRKEVLKAVDDAEEGMVGDGYADEVREACVRCYKRDEFGTMGFFAVGFVREDGEDKDVLSKNSEGEGGEEEWQGFPSDDE